MNVYVINNKLNDFYIDINSIEENGLCIFLHAKNIWADDWDKYLVWYDGKIIQRVFNPDILIFGDRND
jgi:hypothetical protein